MKYPLLIPLTLTAILFISCDKNREDDEKKDSSITINKIEQNITNKETNFGCGDKELEECTEDEIDSAKFILSTLKKDSKSIKEKNITSIKKSLSNSLQEIVEEENKKRRLKDSLEALVNQVGENKKKNLENFVKQIDENEFGTEDDKKRGTSLNKKVANIKNELTSFVEMEESTVKPKEVKKKLENLIADVTESKKSLSQTGKSLTKLVKEAEEKDTPSVKKFASAIIEDVSSKKISIIEENEQYFIIKVQQGDNLSVLAERYYNNKNKYKLIYEANKEKISSGYEIFPGTELLIPKI